MTSTAPLPVARLVVLGLVLWFVVTFAFRLFGHFLLVPGDETRTLLVFAVTPPAMYVLMNAVLRALHISGPTRVVAATLLLAPGLLLDGLVSIPFFAVMFPSMDRSVAALFGALMCAGYASGFLVSLFPGWGVDLLIADSART